MVRLEGVSYRYATAGEWALRDIDLRIEPGECVLIAGDSGCGKSTLLHTVNGLIPHLFPGHLEGQVKVGDVQPGDLPLEKLSQRVGTVFQNPDNQLFMLAVADDVAFGCENLCLPRDEIIERVDESLRQVGLDALRQRAVFSLSGGQKQRCAMAGVLAMSPEVQPAASTRQPPLDRRQGETRQSGNARNGATFEVVEEDDLTVLGGQATEGLPQERYPFPVIQLLIRPWGRSDGVQRGVLLVKEAPSPLLPQPIHGQIGADLTEPRTKPGGVFERGDALVGLEEGFLDQILHLVRSADPIKDHALNEREVPDHQEAEGVSVTSCGSAHQDVVGL